MPLVFDEFEREFGGPAPSVISQFDYLNISSRAEAARVRAAVDDFLSRYPRDSLDGLRNRLRSIDDTTHLAAFFELAVHELLVKRGCKVLEIEPSVTGSSRRPDFLAEAPSGQRFYLETTLATGRSRSDAGAQRRLERAIAAVDSVPSPDHFLELQISGEPSAPVRTSQLARGLRNWLNELRYDDVVAAWQTNPEAIPSFEYDEHGLSFRIRPIPRNSMRGDAKARAIGIRSLEPMWVQPREPIRGAVMTKATRYGDLDLPYIVAVNAMSEYADEDDTIDALLGSDGVSVWTDENGDFHHTATRLPDGAWRDRTGPINTRVSAVLSTERLSPWSLSQRRARLVLNPWAKRPLTELDLGTDSYRPEDGELKRQAGEVVGKLIGLWAEWPE